MSCQSRSPHRVRPLFPPRPGLLRSHRGNEGCAVPGERLALQFGPEPAGDSSKMGGSNGRKFGYVVAQDFLLGKIRLKLDQPVILRRTPVNQDIGYRFSRRPRYFGQYVFSLECNRFKGCPGDLGLAGSQPEATDDGLGLRIPIGSTES